MSSPVDTIDYETIYQRVITLETPDAKDVQVAKFLLNKQLLNIHLINNSPEENRPLFAKDLEDASNRRDRLRSVVTSRSHTLLDTLGNLAYLALKEPSKLDEFDFCLAEAIREALFQSRMYLSKQCKKTTFGKTGARYASFKHLPHKKICRGLYNELRTAIKVAVEIEIMRSSVLNGEKFSDMHFAETSSRQIMVVESLQHSLVANREVIKHWVTKNQTSEK